MVEQLLTWKVIIIGTWLALFFVLERVFPATPWKASDTQQNFSQVKHLIQNFSLWLINILLSPLLVIGLTAIAVEHGLHWSPFQVSEIIRENRLIVDLLILDLWIYAWHLMNHRLPLLWRFHQIHHLDEQLDSTSALRFHVGEVILSAILRMPVIIVFAIPLSSVIVFEILVTCAAIFHHTNVRLPVKVERYLSYIVITPSIHWVHHHAIRKDTDSNYGTVLSSWDRIFQTASETRRTESMVLGVENIKENHLVKLIFMPFK